MPRIELALGLEAGTRVVDAEPGNPLAVSLVAIHEQPDRACVSGTSSRVKARIHSRAVVST